MRAQKKGQLEKELTIADPKCDTVERNKDRTTISNIIIYDYLVI
jgi:hypothetical protein